MPADFKQYYEKNRLLFQGEDPAAVAKRVYDRSGSERLGTSFEDWAKAVNATDFVPSTPPPTPAPKPEAESSIMGTLGASWDAIKGVGINTPAAIAAALEGGDPYASNNALDWIIGQARDYNQGIAEKYKDRSGMERELASFGQTASFTLGGLGASLAAGVPAFAAGGPVAAGVAGGTAGTAATFRMSKNQILRDFREQTEAHLGRKMTSQEWTKAKDGFVSTANKYALWEAGTEVIGTALTLGAAKFLPLNKIVGKTIAGKLAGDSVGKTVARGATRAAAAFGSELAQETVTEVGQDQTLEGTPVGAPKGKALGWNPSDIMTAMGRVAPQTFLMTALLGGGANIGSHIRDRINSQDAEWRDISNDLPAGKKHQALPEGQKKLEPQTKLPEGGTIAGRDESSGPVIVGQDERSKFGPIPQTDGQAQAGVEGRREQALPPGAEPTPTPPIALGPAHRSAKTTSERADGTEFTEEELSQAAVQREVTPETVAGLGGQVVGQARGKDFSRDELSQTSTDRAVTPEVKGNNRGTITEKAKGKEFSKDETAKTSTEREMLQRAQEGLYSNKPDSELAKDRDVVGAIVQATSEGRLDAVSDEQLDRAHHILAVAVGSHRLAGKEFSAHRGDAATALSTLKQEQAIRREAKKDETVAALVVRRNNLQNSLQHIRDEKTASTMQAQLKGINADLENILGKRMEFVSTQDESGVHIVEGEMPAHLQPSSEITKQYNVPANFLTRRRKAGELTGYRQEGGQEYYYDPAELEQFLLKDGDTEILAAKGSKISEKEIEDLTEAEAEKNYFDETEEFFGRGIDLPVAFVDEGTGTALDRKTAREPVTLAVHSYMKKNGYDLRRDEEGSPSVGDNGPQWVKTGKSDLTIEEVGSLYDEGHIGGDSNGYVSGLGEKHRIPFTKASLSERAAAKNNMEPGDIGDSFQHPRNIKNDPSKGPYSWGRKPEKDSIEVSTKGDKLGSAFSAFNAKLKKFNGRTIEAIYQTDIKGYKSIKEGKGKPPLNELTKEELWKEYKDLWWQFADENPVLFEELRKAATGKKLVDRYAKTEINQARALSEILNEYVASPHGSREIRAQDKKINPQGERASVSNAVYNYMRSLKRDVRRDQNGDMLFDSRGNVEWVKSEAPALTIDEVQKLYDEGYINGSDGGFVSGLGVKHEVPYTFAAKHSIATAGGKKNTDNFYRKFNEGEVSQETLTHEDLLRKRANKNYLKSAEKEEASREPVHPKTTEALADAHGRWGATKVNTGGVETGRDAGMKTAQEELNVAAANSNEVKGRLLQQDVFTRADIQANPDRVYLFGDNLQGTGFGGQAKEARNEPNAVGIPTKKAPSMSEDAFFTNADYDEAVAAIDAAFDKIPNDADIVLPSAGLGTGRAQLQARAPKVYEYLQKKLMDLQFAKQKGRQKAEALAAAEKSANEGKLVEPINWPLANRIVKQYESSVNDKAETEKKVREEVQKDFDEFYEEGSTPLRNKNNRKLSVLAIDAMPALRAKAEKILRAVNERFGAKIPVDSKPLNGVFGTLSSNALARVRKSLASVYDTEIKSIQDMIKSGTLDNPGVAKAEKRIRELENKKASIKSLAADGLVLAARKAGADTGIQIHANDLLFSTKGGVYWVVEKMGAKDAAGQPSFVKLKSVADVGGNVIESPDYVTIKKGRKIEGGLLIVPRFSQMFQRDMHKMYVDTLVQDHLDTKTSSPPVRGQIMKGADGKFHLAYFPNETTTTPDLVQLEGDPQPMVTKVISGGQTGADRIGLEAAKGAGIETGGVAPKGYATEKGKDKSLREFGLREHDSGNYNARTTENIKNSDGTVIFAQNEKSPGTQFTRDEAERLGKPCLVNPTAAELRSWLTENGIRTLNIAGNRASRMSANKQAQIRQTLDEALAPGEIASDEDMAAWSSANDLSKREQEAAEIEKGEREQPTRADKMDEKVAQASEMKAKAQEHKAKLEKERRAVEASIEVSEAKADRLDKKAEYYAAQVEEAQADTGLSDTKRKTNVKILTELQQEQVAAAEAARKDAAKARAELAEIEERIENFEGNLTRLDANLRRYRRETDQAEGARLDHDEIVKMFGSMERAALSEAADGERGTGSRKPGAEAGVEAPKGVNDGDVDVKAGGIKVGDRVLPNLTADVIKTLDLSDTATKGGKFKQKAVRNSVMNTGRKEGGVVSKEKKSESSTNQKKDQRPLAVSGRSPMALDDRPRTFQGEGIEDGGTETAETMSFVQLEEVEKEGRVLSRHRSDWGIYVTVKGKDGSIQTYKVQGGKDEMTRVGAEFTPGAAKRKKVFPPKAANVGAYTYDLEDMQWQLDKMSFHLDGDNLTPSIVDNASALPADIINDESVDHENAAVIIHGNTVYFIADKIPTQAHFWNAVGQVGQYEYNANDAEVWSERMKGTEELYNSYGWKGYDGKGKPRFRTKATLPTTSTLGMRAAKTVVKNLKRALKFGAGVKVNLYSSFTTMPPSLQAGIRRMSKAHSAVGFVYGGEVHIILDRHADAKDLVQTVLHEVIGHHGMREMLGQEYDTFLDQTANRFKAAILQILSGEKLLNPDVYLNEEERTLLQKFRGQQVDWDAIPQDHKRKAAEELLSTWFERTEQQEDGSYKNPLINNSLNRIIAMLTRAVRKLANKFGKDFELTHTEIKEMAARAMAGVDLKEVTGFEFAAKEVFGTNKEPMSLDQFAGYWESFRDRTMRLLGDEFRSVDLLQRAYEKSTGERVSESMDAHGKIGLKDSRVDHRVKEAKAKYLDPLLAEMKKQGVTSQELSDYLYAQFAPHRNQVIARVTQGANLKGSGMTDQEAQDILDGFDADKTAKLEALAQKVYEVNSARLDVLLEYGLEKPRTVEKWRRSNGGRYVPLRADEDVMDDSGLAAMSVTGKASKTAEGRTTRAQDPLAWSFYQLFNTYARGERNEISKSLYELAKEIDNQDIIEIFDPEAERAIAQQLGQPFGGEMPAGWDPEKLVGVRLNGRQVFLNIRHQWVRKEFLREGKSEPTLLIRALGTYNRWIAMANVFFDPQFLISNGSRDFQTAMGNLNLRDNVGGMDAKTFSGKVAKSTPAMAREIFRVETGKGSSTIYERYRELGGKTGYSNFATIEQTIKNIQRDIKRSEKSLYGAALASFDKIEGAFGIMNDTVENAVRLATFKQALDAGMSEHEAITLAKNLTVNFSRKGAIGTFLNSYKLFFNASLQSSIIIARLVKNNPAKAKKLLTGVAAAGFLISEFNYLLAGDDDDGENLWKKTEEWKRKSYVILSFPGNHQLMLPKAYGFGAFYDFGQMLSRMLHADNVGKAAGEVSWFADSVLQNFSPLQVGVPVEDSSSGSQALLQFLLPTAASIPLELGYNRDWKGDTIMHDSEGKAAFNGAQAAGHILDTLGGGAKRFFAEDLPTNIAAIASGEYGNLPPYKRLTRKFYGNVPRYQLNKAYWAADRELKSVETAYQRKRAKLGNTYDRETYKRRLEDLKEYRKDHEDVFRFQGKARAYKERIKVLRGKIEAARGGQKASLEDQMYKLQGRFLREYRGLTD